MPARPAPTRHGLARTLSKLGLCSRTEATRWILAGRVAVHGDPVPLLQDRMLRIADHPPVDRNPAGQHPTRRLGAGTHAEL